MLNTERHHATANYAGLSCCLYTARYSHTMLPCNVLVQEHEDGKVEVSAVNLMQSIGVVGNPELEGTATQVSERLKAALDRI